MVSAPLAFAHLYYNMTPRILVTFSFTGTIRQDFPATVALRILKLPEAYLN